LQVVHDALPQQTDSTQLPLAHPAPVVHDAPSGAVVVVVVVPLVLLLVLLLLVLPVLVLPVLVLPVLVLLDVEPLELVVLPEEELVLLLVDPPAPAPPFPQVTSTEQSEERL
jgi:hypothetical protein